MLWREDQIPTHRLFASQLAVALRIRLRPATTSHSRLNRTRKPIAMVNIIATKQTNANSHCCAVPAKRSDDA